MEYRALGNTGLVISELGLGAAGLANLYETLDDEQGAAVVRRALDLGITYVDTAPMYGSGTSERRIGLALRDHPRAGSCVVATKLGYYPEGFDFSYDATLRSVEDSLSRLGLSAIPLLQIHEISAEIWDRLFARHGALAALRALQSQGLVERVGVTGSDLRLLEAAVDTGEFETMLLWRHYHLLDTSGARVIERAARRGMGVIVGTPFAGGILASGDVPEARYFYRPAGPEERARTRALQDDCARRGVALAAAALHFCLAPAGVATVIAGADRPEHVERNLRDINAVGRRIWPHISG